MIGCQKVASQWNSTVLYTSLAQRRGKGKEGRRAKISEGVRGRDGTEEKKRRGGGVWFKKKKKIREEGEGN